MRDFIDTISAYNEKILEQHFISRRLAYFSFLSVGVQLKSNPARTEQQFNEKFWPLPSDIEAKEKANKERLERAKQMYEQNKLEHGRRSETENIG